MKQHSHVRGIVKVFLFVVILYALQTRTRCLALQTAPWVTVAMDSANTRQERISAPVLWTVTVEMDTAILKKIPSIARGIVQRQLSAETPYASREKILPLASRTVELATVETVYANPRMKTTTNALSIAGVEMGYAIGQKTQAHVPKTVEGCPSAATADVNH